MEKPPPGDFLVRDFYFIIGTKRTNRAGVRGTGSGWQSIKAALLTRSGRNAMAAQFCL